MTKRKNKFFHDAYKIFKVVSKNIANNDLKDDWSIINNTLWFAIGVEKILKAVLYNVNPTFILKTPEFNNSMQVYYSSIILDNEGLSKSINSDVIAFQNTVLRCVTISSTVKKHKNILLKLKNARDIIVHNNFDSIDTSEMKKILKRDFYTFLSELSDEYDLKGQTNFFNNLNSKLAKISSSLQEDVAEKIRLKIESAKAQWNVDKGRNTYNRKKDEVETVNLLKKDIAYPTKCPSCNNYAVVFTSRIMEYDNTQKEMIQIGLDTRGFRCEFCKLEITDSKEFDELGISPNITRKDEIIKEYSNDVQS